MATMATDGRVCALLLASFCQVSLAELNQMRPEEDSKRFVYMFVFLLIAMLICGATAFVAPGVWRRWFPDKAKKSNRREARTEKQTLKVAKVHTEKNRGDADAKVEKITFKRTRMQNTNPMTAFIKP